MPPKKRVIDRPEGFWGAGWTENEEWQLPLPLNSQPSGNANADTNTLHSSKNQAANQFNPSWDELSYAGRAPNRIDINELADSATMEHNPFVPTSSRAEDVLTKQRLPVEAVYRVKRPMPPASMPVAQKQRERENFLKTLIQQRNDFLKKFKQTFTTLEEYADHPGIDFGWEWREDDVANVTWEDIKNLDEAPTNMLASKLQDHLMKIAKEIYEMENIILVEQTRREEEEMKTMLTREQSVSGPQEGS